MMETTGLAGSVCRQCGQPALKALGPLPPGELFAGQPLDPPWPGGTLYLCRACGLGQRIPLMPMAAYEALYASAPATVWSRSTLRPDQLLVKDCIESTFVDGASVLDVGCYDGALLQALGPEHRRFGVEASQAAAVVARQAGIEIIAQRIDELDAVGERFDVVCAIDVIEHVAEPQAFLQTLVRRTLPGGLIIVSTGALDTVASRLAAGRWWYASFPEHISFLSERWARRVAPRLGLVLERCQRFSYGADAGEALDEPARARWRFWRRALKCRLLRREKPKVLGTPGLFADHLLLVWRVPGPQR